MVDAGMEIKVGADFSELKRGVDDAKQKLAELRREQRLLKQETKDVTFSIKANDKAIADATKRLKEMTIVSRGDRDEARRLKREIRSLGGVSQKLAATQRDTTAAMRKNTVALKEQAAAVKTAGASGAGMARGLTKGYNVLRRLAYIVPGLGIGGLVLLISGPLVSAFKSWFGVAAEVTAQQKALKDGLESATSSVAKEVAKIAELIAIASNLTQSYQARVDAIRKLQELEPEIFGNIDTEKIKIGQLNGAYKEYLNSLRARIQLEANKSAFESGVKGEFKLKDKIKALKEYEARLKKTIKDSPQIATYVRGVKVKDKRVGNLEDLQAKIRKTTKALETLISKDDELGSSLGKAPQGPKSAQNIYGELSKSYEKLAVDEKTFNVSKTKEKIGLIRKAILDLQNISRLSADSPLVENLKNWGESLGGFADTAKATASRASKSIGSIDDVIDRLSHSLYVIGQQELIFKDDRAQAKIKAIEAAMSTLVDKFKQTSTSPIIIDLNAKIGTIELDSLLKNSLDQSPIDLSVPVDLTLTPGKPPRMSPDYEKQFKIEDLQKQLQKLGVTHTLKGGLISVENFKDADVALKNLNDTLDSVYANLDRTAQFAIDALGPALDSVFNAIADGGNAFESVGQAIEKMIRQLIIAAAKAAVLALVISAITGKSFTVAFKGLLGFKDGGPVKRASGGSISGPGSSRSDSIPAMLSNGEYVIQAASVKKFGKGFFDAINFSKRIPMNNHFADGGIVRGSDSVGISSGVHVTGDFKIRNDVLVAAVKRGTKQLNRQT